MRNAFIRGLTALAEQDDRVIFLTGDLGYKIFDDFARRFAGRFLNAGTAEANMIGVAAGLALGGLRPIVYSIAPFATLRCLEQIRNDICYNDVAVTIVGVGGGYSYGPNGPTHHALEDIAVMRSLPRMTVVCPGDPVETELAVLASHSHRGPLYLRLGRAGDPEVHSSPPDFAIGQAITLRDGADVSVISTGGILPVAAAVAERLEAEGISCRVVSMHTVKPLDADALRDCCDRTGAIVTLEEHSRIGGLGSAVGEWLAANHVHCPLHSFGAADEFAARTGSQSYLREQQGLTADRLAPDILQGLKEQDRC